MLAPPLSLAALASRGNAAALVPGTPFLAAEDHPGLCARYLALNRAAFSAVPLAGWVLSDLYLLPTAIALILGPGDRLDPRVRLLEPATDAILAAYVAVPTLISGTFLGVSLFSFAPGLAALAKRHGLAMLGARRARGVAQWGLALRTHTRLGAMRIVGRVPGAHELGATSFVYETVLDDVDRAMARQLELPVRDAIPVHDTPALAARVAAAEAGTPVCIVPPGFRDGRILFG
jgi:hypothetical protein